MIYGRFRGTGAHDAALDLSVLFSFSSQGDDIQDFDTRWDQASLSASEVTNDDDAKCNSSVVLLGLGSSVLQYAFLASAAHELPLFAADALFAREV